jgi:DNA-binding SARP family transcriptional activator
MRFSILGPIEVLHGNHKLPTGSVRERRILVALLLNASRVTTSEALIEALWEDPPPSAKAQVHNLLCNIRRRFRDDRDLIKSRCGNYQLDLESHDLDLAEFRSQATHGRRHLIEGDYHRALPALTAALSIWRGPALDDSPTNRPALSARSSTKNDSSSRKPKSPQSSPLATTTTFSTTSPR